jgi:hypothetical protein
LDLLREFLEFYGLEYTASVFIPEANLVSSSLFIFCRILFILLKPSSFIGRRSLAQQLNLNASTNLPLLFEVLSKSKGGSTSSSPAPIRLAEQDKLKREQEEKAKREQQDKLKREQEEKAKRDLEEKQRQERLKKEQEDKAKKEREEKAKKEQEEKLKQQAAAQKKTEAPKTFPDPVKKEDLKKTSPLIPLASGRSSSLTSLVGMPKPGQRVNSLEDEEEEPKKKPADKNKPVETKKIVAHEEESEEEEEGEDESEENSIEEEIYSEFEEDSGELVI